MVGACDGFVSRGGRAQDNEIVWFFIGTHADYDRMLAKL